MEVRFAAKEAVQKHQGGAFSFPIEDIVGQADRAEKKKHICVMALCYRDSNNSKKVLLERTSIYRGKTTANNCLTYAL